MNKLFRGGGYGHGSENPSPSPEKPKVYRKVDAFIRIVTVVACLPFLFIGYGLGAAYAFTKTGWNIGRNDS